jgi:hypothetical protein
MVGGVDICAVGVREKQQRQTRQTCVNIVEIYKCHIRQKCRTNVPNPKGDPVVVLYTPIFIFLGTKLEDTRFCTR